MMRQVQCQGKHLILLLSFYDLVVGWFQLVFSILSNSTLRSGIKQGAKALAKARPFFCVFATQRLPTLANTQKNRVAQIILL